MLRFTARHLQYEYEPDGQRRVPTAVRPVDPMPAESGPLPDSSDSK